MVTEVAMGRLLAVSVLTVLLSFACGGGGDDPDCTLVVTPNGMWPRACVHEVPNGATVTETDGGVTVVTVGGVVVATYPPCPCAHE
jgi:hypothetical protein